MKNKVSEPEFIGKFPIRQELTVLSADDPHQKQLGWSFHMISDEEHNEINSEENLKKAKK